MSTLNVVNKSPFEKRTLEQCLARIGDGDGILLTFESASAAVQWSLDVQKEIKDARLESINPFRGLALRNILLAADKSVRIAGAYRFRFFLPAVVAVHYC